MKSAQKKYNCFIEQSLVFLEYVFHSEGEFFLQTDCVELQRIFETFFGPQLLQQIAYFFLAYLRMRWPENNTSICNSFCKYLNKYDESIIICRCDSLDFFYIHICTTYLNTNTLQYSCTFTKNKYDVMIRCLVVVTGRVFSHDLKSYVTKF